MPDTPRFDHGRIRCGSCMGQWPQGAAIGGLVNAYESGVAGTVKQSRVSATAGNVRACQPSGVAPGYLLILVILLPWIPTPAMSPVWPKMNA